MRAIEPAPGSSFSFEEGESFGVRLAGEKGEEEAGVAPEARLPADGVLLLVLYLESTRLD